MSYTGDVTRGGPADVRELPGLTISKVSVGPMDNNAYLLRCTRTGSQLLIDAANEADRLLGLVGEAGLDLIVTTHRHQDHWMALKEVAEATGAPVAAHPVDATELPVTVAERPTHGDTINVGDAELEVIHLRGHTPGSIALVYGDHVFTGDSLFPGGVGNTWGNAENFKQLMTDVTERLFDRLPDRTWIYPGHGKDTTLGAERPSIAGWWARGW